MPSPAEPPESGKCSAEREVRQEVDRAFYFRDSCGRKLTSQLSAYRDMTLGSVLLVGHGVYYASTNLTSLG